MVSLPAQEGSEVTHPLVSGSHTTRCQTHLSLRLTVHGEFPGIPLTMRILVGWKRSSLFPHSVNSTFSAHTRTHIQWRCCIAWRRTKGHQRLPFRLISLVQKLTYWFIHGHLLSSCGETEMNRLAGCQPQSGV